MGASAVNCQWNSVINYRCGGSKIACFFQKNLVFFLIHYAIDVYALVSCLFIVMCCLFILIVENTDDDSGETKSIFVENFGDVKLLKIEAKPNIDGASVHVEASLYVDSGVVPLDANEVHTDHFFFEEV